MGYLGLGRARQRPGVRPAPVRLAFLLLAGLGALQLAACSPRPLPASPAGRPAEVAAATATVVAAAPAASAPVPSATATNPPTVTAAVPTATPPRATGTAAITITDTVTGTLAASKIPEPQGLERFAFGVPAGDTYAPASLAVDPVRKLAFVYNTRSGTADAGTAPVIAVVDLAQAAVLREFPAPADRYASRGQLLLAADGATGYLVDQDKGMLTVFDPATGAWGAQIAGVAGAALSADGRLLFVIGRDEGLAARRVGDLTVQWEVTGARLTDLAANGDGVAAVSVEGGEPQLAVYDGATGAPRGRALLPESADALVAGPAGGWAVRLGGVPGRLLRFGPGLAPLAEREIPFGEGLFYDAAHGRYLVGGVEGSTDHTMLAALAADDLAAQGQVDWSWQGAPNRFAAYGDQIVGCTAGAGAYLSYVDAGSLQPAGRAILGVTLAGMALDEATQTLYVADNQDRIHVLGLPGGEERATWPGRAGIALDAANGRLYANRAEGVVALDIHTGQVLAQFPQGGVPAADPKEDYVYIAADGITVYSRDGQARGRLDSTFPRESAPVPNPYAFNVRVNPFNGAVAAGMNNGVPGSNNASYLQFYPPGSDQPAPAPGSLGYVTDLIYDPAGGRAFAAYSSFKTGATVQILDANGAEVARLNGREGALALDRVAKRLYVARGGAVARLDAETLDLDAVFRGPAQVSQALLNAASRQIYFRSDSAPAITVARLDALPALENGAQPVPGLPAEALSGLWATAGSPSASLQRRSGGQGTQLYALAGSDLYRSRPSAGGGAGDRRWEKLAVGSFAGQGWLTTAADGVLFFAGQAADGGDGVWRSRDGGDSWELLAHGLTDLRAGQEVVAAGADQAYYTGMTGGAFAWQAGSGRWQPIAAAGEGQDGARLSLAPDGTLYALAWDTLRRSTDGGQTWVALQPPAEGAELLQIVAERDGTQTLYAFYGSEQTRVVRSRDHGATWQAADGGLALPGYLSGLKLLAGEATLYLYDAGYGQDALLYRSQDGGASWQVPAGWSLEGAGPAALAPDGRMWLALAGGGLREVDPAALVWQTPPPPTATPVVPTPTATAVPPTPSATPSCWPPAGEAPPELAAALGCPRGAARDLSGAVERFERGLMIWRGDDRTILVLPDGAAWQRFPDTWQEGEPETDPGLTAPITLLQPVRGFGKVWREQLGGATAAIGWAREPEAAFTGTLQDWDNGFLLRWSETSVAVLADGGWR